MIHCVCMFHSLYVSVLCVPLIIRPSFHLHVQIDWTSFGSLRHRTTTAPMAYKDFFVKKIFTRLTAMTKVFLRLFDSQSLHSYHMHPRLRTSTIVCHSPLLSRKSVSLGPPHPTNRVELYQAVFLCWCIRPQITSLLTKSSQ